MTGSVEREVKFGGPPGFEMPELSGVLPGVSAVPLPRLDLDATYYDTADLRLVRSGVSLRRRTGDGPPTWTLKLPAGASTTVLQRREFDIESDSLEVPELFIGLVAGWARLEPLVAVIDILSRRERLALIDGAGVDLAEVDDDRVTVVEGGVTAATFREIELELTDSGTDELLDAVSARLLAVGAGAPDPMSKVARALGPRALAPSVFEGPVPRRDASIAEVMSAGLRSAVSDIVVNDHVIRLDDDPMGLHRARWALRRIRADLKTFTRHFDDAYLDHLRTEMRWLSEEFGTLRRADVLVESVERALASARDNDVAAVQGLIDRARRERQRAHASVIEVLGSTRYVALLDALVAITRPTALFSGTSAAAVEVIPSAMMRVWKRVRAAVRDLSDEPSESEIRQVRGQIIRIRSATELAVPVFGAAASDFAALTAQAQHDLGRHLDALACERWLRSRVVSLEGLEPFVAGQLVAAQSVVSDQALRAWLDSWRACSNRSAVAWFRS